MNDQKLWVKFLVVFFYHGIGSVLPLFLAWMNDNAYYIVLIPIVKGAWEMVEKWLKDERYLGGAKYH